MGSTPVNVADTGYSIFYHYSDGVAFGGYVICEDCKVGKSFVSLKPMDAWLNLHARPGMFGCRALATATTR
jgi:hypothetical protein